MNTRKRTPKKGDRVSAHGKNGAFVVSTVNGDLKSVVLQQIGHDLALDAIPWDSLTYLDELDESQNALRVVREATEGESSFRSH